MIPSRVITITVRILYVMSIDSFGKSIVRGNGFGLWSGFFSLTETKCARQDVHGIGTFFVMVVLTISFFSCSATIACRRESSAREVNAAPPSRNHYVMSLSLLLLLLLLLLKKYSLFNVETLLARQTEMNRYILLLLLLY